MANISTQTRPQLNALLNKLGIPEDFAADQAKLLSTSSVSILKQLQTELTTANQRGPGASKFTAMMQEKDRRLPPFGWNRHPRKMLPIMEELCGAGCAHHGGQGPDTIKGSRRAAFERLFNRRHRTGAKFERLLRSNPQARAAFEAAVGGRIAGFERRDGAISVQRFTARESTPNYNNAPPQQLPATTAMGALAGMEAAILAQARRVAAIQGGTANGQGAVAGSGGYGSTAFGQYVAGGLSNVANGMSGAGFGAFGGALGGAGTGSWNPLAMPGRVNNTNPLYERAHQAEVDGILNDPSLTVEDKVTLMLMTVANKFDDDILRQGQYVNSVQQQQSNRSGSGKGIVPASSKVGTTAGGALGGPAAAVLGMSGAGASPLGGKVGGGETGAAPSVDIESLKLKRMIDKRNQMFDILRSIIDKYNETAKNIIQSIGR